MSLNLYDRIKELSHTVGTGNIRLDGAAKGFSAFGDRYAYNDLVYYAVTDGTSYEVGSGQYIQSGGINYITRYPFNSTNSNNLVNFPNGVKEIYATYPGKYSVFTASGISSFKEPKSSGIAFWGSKHILDYSENILFDKNNTYIGINKSNPTSAIDIGGPNTYSRIKVSGIQLGPSGLSFQNTNSYSGGQQLEPFMRNVLNDITGVDAVFSLSGLVDQIFVFNKQNAGLVFAGPPSGCGSPPCQPNYPSFRALTSEDMPDLSDLYLDKLSYTDNDYLKISTFTTFSIGSGAIGSPSNSNKGVLFFAEDTNNLYISDGIVWKSGQFI